MPERPPRGQGALVAAALVLSAVSLALALSGGKGGEPARVMDDSDLDDRKSLEGRIADLEKRAESAEARTAVLESRLAAAEKSASLAAGEAAKALDASRAAGGAAPLLAELTPEQKRAELDARIRSLEAEVAAAEKDGPGGDFPATCRRLAESWREAGDPEKAKDALRRGLRVFPRDEGLRSALDDLR